MCRIRSVMVNYRTQVIRQKSCSAADAIRKGNAVHCNGMLSPACNAEEYVVLRTSFVCRWDAADLQAVQAAKQ